MTERIIRVSEIFGPTIQGEGAQIGRPTVFVRTGGCDYRCSWCDSMYAVLPEYRHTWEKLTAAQIIDRINALAKHEILVTLSGGNPAMQPGLGEVIEIGHTMGHEFTMETQGTICPEWLSTLDYLCISPKPPSSNMETDYGQLEAMLSRGPKETILKVVVFDETDYLYAQDMHGRYPQFPFYLQVGNRNPKQDQEANVSELLSSLSTLSERVIADGMYEAKVLPQLHTLMWSNKRGV